MTEQHERVFSAPREWTHVHPVSPLLGGWAVFAAAIGYWFSQGPGAPSSEEQLDLHLTLARVALIVAALAALAIGFGYLSWSFHTYRITDEAIEQRKGLLMRQHRQARLDRVQAVDVVQPLVSRIFGFAKLTVEVAGGEKSGIQLMYLRLADAEALRNEVLLLAAGFRAEVAARSSGEDAPRGEFSLRHEMEGFRLAPAPGSAHTAVAAAEERPLVAVPIPRLLGSIALSWGTVTMVILAVVFAAGSLALGIALPEVDLVAVFFGGGFFGVLSALFGMFTYAMASLNRGMNFRLGISQDGVRLAHGLMETRRQTIPPGRVQAVQFKQSLLWRGRDWWEIVANVAGYQDDQQAVSTLMPVGTRGEALTALWSVLPNLGDADPAGTVSRALSGSGAEGGFVTAPRAARWIDPIQWRQRGVRATDTALFIRRGRLVRELMVVPHERTQSLAITQGVLERALGLATVEVHSTKGVVRPVAQHLAVADAIALVEAQAQRARERRKVQTPEQWMAKVGLADADADADAPSSAAQSEASPAVTQEAPHDGR